MGDARPVPEPDGLVEYRAKCWTRRREERPDSIQPLIDFKAGEIEVDESDPAIPLEKAPSPGTFNQVPLLFRPLRTGLFRVPLLPVESLSRLAEPGSARDVQLGCFGRSLFRADPNIRLALCLGSPSLYESLVRETAEPPSEGSHLPKKDRLRVKLDRYLTRMATRPTPFGLFAGVSLIEFGDRTTLKIGRAVDRRASRPSMEALDKFVQSLEEKVAVRRKLKWIRNPMAWERVERLVVNASSCGGSKTAAGRSVELTPLVRKLMDAARQPVAWSELLFQVCASEGLSAEDAEQLLTGLWRQQVFLSDLAPSVTGALPSEALALRLATIDGIEEERAGWNEWLRTLESADALDPKEAISQYRMAREQAHELVGSCAGDPIHLDAQTALFGNQISNHVATAAAYAAELLIRLAPSPAGSSVTAAYRQLFIARYGEGREVPVLELLDPNVGIGPYSLQVLKAPRNEAGSRRSSLLANLACRAIRGGKREIELDEATIQQLECGSPTSASAPASLDLNVLVAATSAEAIDEGHFELIVGPNVGAPAAGRHLGRFAHLLGEHAEQALRTIATAEQSARPGPIDVELVYPAPTGQLGNVVVRPRVRPREMRVGIAPPPGDAGQIEIGEILVGVEGNRFRLRCARLNRPLQFTSGHMLNPWLAPEVCRFLMAASRDAELPLSGFHWGEAESFPYLPRIRVGKIILRLAEWKLAKADFSSSTLADAARFRASLNRWRELWTLPRLVFLARADQRLLWDLSLEECVEALRRELDQLPASERIVVQEALPTPDQLWAAGPAGSYYSELVVSLVASPANEAEHDDPLSLKADTTLAAEDGKTSANQDSVAVPHPPAKAVDTRFPPGSAWLYLKLYCGPDFLEEIIADQIPRVLNPFSGRGVIDKWFFLRYLDPDPHLRLRLHGPPGLLWERVLPHASAMATEWMATGLCQRFSIETYEPEIDRYGGAEGMELAENFFHADSVAVVDYLRAWRDAKARPPLQDLAVATVDTLLAGLILDESHRFDWIRQQGPKSIPIGAEFRERKEFYRSWLTAPGRADAVLGETYAKIGERFRESVRPTALRLASCSEQGTLSRPLGDVVRSFVHLHCNRLLGTNRYAELRVRELLRRTRDSLAAAPVLGAAKDSPNGGQAEEG